MLSNDVGKQLRKEILSDTKAVNEEFTVREGRQRID